MALSNEIKERTLEELKELLRIPSVSTDKERIPDIKQCAEWVADNLRQCGADSVEIFDTPGHPIVYGEAKASNPDAPTVLVYGHYDVQPADPIELWDSPPFDPVIKGERIYARGATDDKGQFFTHVKAFELIKQNEDSLPCHLKFLIEGEEEIGSPNLEKFIRDHADMLSADYCVVSDTSMIASDTPSINVGLRGLSYIEVEVVGPNRDLHSGTYGGGVVNPLNALCEIVAKLKDGQGRVTIPGFYDDVVDLSDDERTKLNERPFDLDEYKSHLDIDAVGGETGYNTVERTGIRPTLDLNGIWGGYTGEGAKTVLPSKAQAKISMRLVANQDHEKISQLAVDYIKSLAPAGTKVKAEIHHGGAAAQMSTDSNGYKAAAKAMEEIWGKEPVPTYAGGSIPIVALLQEVITDDVVMLGLGLDEDALHSPNESFRVDHFHKGIETCRSFYYALAV